MVYGQNLTECVKFRISKRDLDFYKRYAAEHDVSVSEAIRHILTDYRIYYEQVVIACITEEKNCRHHE